uniref:carnosine N-methyltransferase n=1 Tax=Steinernema glaseri TaxID=37863 RepID=A0A1I7Z0K7_9BILA
MSEAPQTSAYEEERTEEAETTAEVLNALAYYKKYSLLELSNRAQAYKRLPVHHRDMIAPAFEAALRKAKECINENQKFLDTVLESGRSMLGPEGNGDFLEKAYSITALRPATEHYMKKVRSTLRQLKRDWSEEGRAERDSCYSHILKAMEERYPDVEKRKDVQVVVPGSGLARLVWQLVQDGFSTMGNEYSMLMLLVSNYILNCCDEEKQFTIYPYVGETSNQWSYENQLRGIRIPDVCPKESGKVRGNTFSMCAGDFVSAMEDYNESFDCVITCFFLDTATTPFVYLDVIKRILKPGGVWINFGPLLYHYAGEHQDAIELPYEEIIKLVRTYGFDIVKDERFAEEPSKYVCDEKSMLQYTYYCGYFECTKKTTE